MIVFQGNISPRNVAKQIKRTSLMVGLSGITVCVVLILVMLLLYFVNVVSFESLKEILITGGVTGILGILVIFMPKFMIDTSRGRANTIEIDKTRIRCERLYHALPFVEISVNEVKKVLDYGECYYIIYTDIAQAIICQKDLIKEGTIEEFESLFAKKIKRKCRKNKR